MNMPQGKAVAVTGGWAAAQVATLTISEWAALFTSILGGLWFCCLMFKFFYRKEWKKDHPDGKYDGHL